ncbi:MAG: LCP family protein [Clostridia bacterium]|nr:LCP family protein [Clostridia bacterium]
MARKKNLVFETKKRSDRGNTRKFWLALITGVLIILVASTTMILKSNDFDINSAFGFEKETEVTQETTEVQPVTFEAERTFLIWCADSRRENIHFLSLVKVSLPKCKVTVCSIDPKTTLSENGSAASIYLKSGESALVSALETTYGINIDRYISATETDFKSFVNYFGGIKITIPEQINYRNEEMSLVLIKGNQSLKGDTLFKYMLYLNSLGYEGKLRQSGAISEMLGNIFSPGNQNKSNRIFKQITNDMSTDISIVDFSSEADGINMLMQNGILQVEIVELPENFRGK